MFKVSILLIEQLFNRFDKKRFENIQRNGLFHISIINNNDLDFIVLNLLDIIAGYIYFASDGFRYNRIFLKIHTKLHIDNRLLANLLVMSHVHQIARAANKVLFVAEIQNLEVFVYLLFQTILILQTGF